MAALTKKKKINFSDPQETGGLSKYPTDSWKNPWQKVLQKKPSNKNHPKLGSFFFWSLFWWTTAFVGWWWYFFLSIFFLSFNISLSCCFFRGDFHFTAGAFYLYHIVTGRKYNGANFLRIPGILNQPISSRQICLLQTNRIFFDHCLRRDSTTILCLFLGWRRVWLPTNSPDIYTFFFSCRCASKLAGQSLFWALNKKIPSGKHSWLEYPNFSTGNTSSIRVHFPASYVSLPECSTCSFFIFSPGLVVSLNIFFGGGVILLPYHDPTLVTTQTDPLPGTCLDRFP